MKYFKLLVDALITNRQNQARAYINGHRLCY